MNAGIAELLRARVATITYIDKLAGLVQPVTYQRQDANNKTSFIRIPVALNVVDPLNCMDEVIRELVPNQGYRMIVYFEDRAGARIVEHQGRHYWESTLRLVAWVNTAKMNGNPIAGDLAMQAIVKAVNQGNPYNSNQYLTVRHRVVSMPPKGAALFNAYTYPEGVRQYLFPPFDSFALDITTRFNFNPDCGPALDPTDIACP